MIPLRIARTIAAQIQDLVMTGVSRVFLVVIVPVFLVRAEVAHGIIPVNLIHSAHQGVIVLTVAVTSKIRVRSSFSELFTKS